MTQRAQFLGVAACLLLVISQGAAEATASGDAGPTGKLMGPFGRGANAVWLLTPSRPVRSIVVFGHGWKVAPPSPLYPWVGQFRPWLDHLLARGNAIIFPRYQLGSGDDSGAARIDAYRAGLQQGFARLGRARLPVVAVGYSYGGSLAFYYAANARRWNLPVPTAVDAFFPAGTIRGAPLPRLPGSVRVLIQVGDRDTQAGSPAGHALWNQLAGHPAGRKEYQTIVSTGDLSAVHAAPKEHTLAAQRAFWGPLDRLIGEARRAPTMTSPVTGKQK